MVSFKKTVIMAGLLTFLPASTLLAATELTQEQANSLTPFKEVSVRGAYLSFSDAAKDINRLADKAGAASYYMKSMNLHSSNESLRIVYADLYKADAAKIDVDAKNNVENFRQFRGVYEYPKRVATGFEPYDLIKLRGYYPNQHDINNAVGKAAEAKGSYAFFIDRQIEVHGKNTEITAYLFKKDAPIRHVQPDDAIPYDSEAGRLALAQGGDAALQVEKPGYYSSTAFNEEYYTQKFSQQSAAATSTTVAVKPSATSAETRVQTTVTSTTPASSQTAQAPAGTLRPQQNTRFTYELPNGGSIQELNDATAAKMVPFDSLKFKGYYVSDSEIVRVAARRAGERGAKYFHITRIAEDSRGPNRTVYVDLYR